MEKSFIFVCNKNNNSTFESTYEGCNKDKAETDIFLLAVVALLATGGLGYAFCPEGICVPFIGEILSDIVNLIGILVMPAAVLIALKAIWEVGSTRL